MMREYISSVPDRPAIYRRLVALGPVLLLHVGLLIAFLHMNWISFHEGNAPDHEIILLLKPAPTVPNWQGDLLPSLDGAALALPRPVLPPIRTYKSAATDSTTNPEKAASELRGVSQALFRCWSDSLTGLRQVQEAQCLTFAPDQLPDFLEPPSNRGTRLSGFVIGTAEMHRSTRRAGTEYPLRLSLVWQTDW
jgi:hypothetical protein